jgi:hypothetical protein
MRPTLEIRSLAQLKAHKREALTAMDAAAVFTDTPFRTEPKLFYGRRAGVRFHPMDRSPHLFSPRPPDVALCLSSAAMCLQHQLTRFLDELDRLLGPNPERRQTNRQTNGFNENS